MAEDRFSQIENTESLCFLCLKKADQLCKKCEIPYCSQEHFNVHYDEKIDFVNHKGGESKIEQHQRNNIINGIRDASDNDLIILFYI